MPNNICLNSLTTSFRYSWIFNDCRPVVSYSVHISGMNDSCIKINSQCGSGIIIFNIPPNIEAGNYEVKVTSLYANPFLKIKAFCSLFDKI